MPNRNLRISNNNTNSLYAHRNVNSKQVLGTYKPDFKLNNNTKPLPLKYRMEALKQAARLPNNLVLSPRTKVVRNNTNSVKQDLNNNVRPNTNNNNTNSVKQALDNKINNDFDGKTYDLIVHFKGFNELFKEGTYNGYSRETLENINFTEEDKISHIDDIVREYLSVIKKQLNGKLADATLLLVWDGDGLDDFQWTRVMIATAQKLVEQGANIEFLCCYDLKTPENQWGVEDPTNALIKLGYENNHIYEYKDLGVKDYNEVGMVLLYVTSNLINKNNNPILVLCAGGGDTPVNEYKFTRKVSANLTDKNHPLAMKLINSMIPDKFKWMASNKVHSRKNKNKNNGVEKSQMTKTNEIQLINSIQSGVKLTGRGGARKKRTIKKKKSLKKKSKKNKSKNKRKC